MTRGKNLGGEGSEERLTTIENLQRGGIVLKQKAR